MTRGRPPKFAKVEEKLSSRKQTVQFVTEILHDRCSFPGCFPGLHTKDAEEILEEISKLDLEFVDVKD